MLAIWGEAGYTRHMGRGQGQSGAGEPREMTDDQKARLDAFKDSVHEVVEGAVEGDDDFAAAFAQMTHIAKGMDLQEMLNSIHVPEDAGEFEEGLRRIMVRIPDGWGRWISCDKGWYKLLTDLDAELMRIVPGYEVHQAKEKYGTLRFYASTALNVIDESLPEPECPKDVEWDSKESKAWRRKHKAWAEKQDAYRESPEGAKRVREAEAQVKLFDGAIKDAEELAAKTCELCGSPGELHLTMAASPWYKTLCASCAEEQGGYIKAGEYDAWWKEEEPKFKAHMKEWWQERERGKRFVVLSLDESKVLGVDATYIRDPEAAAQVALEGTGKWDGVFVDDDTVGKAYMDALAERYREHVAENERVRTEAWAESPPNNMYKTEKPEGLPQLYYLARDLPAPSKMFRQDLGASCWLSQDEHFA